MAQGGYIGRTSLIPAFQGNIYINKVYLESGSGTYNPPAAVSQLKVEVQGAGGGGAGVPSTSASQGAASGSGGSGGYSQITISNPSASYTYDIGIAGTGGSAGQNGGNDGTATTFTDGVSVNIICNPGTGGVSMAATATSGSAGGGVGGTATGGDFNVNGVRGGTGFITDGDRAELSNGGNSYLGLGATGRISANGTDASGYGAGGSGANNNANNGAKPGGNGSGGIIIIEEIYLIGDGSDYASAIATQTDMEGASNSLVLSTPGNTIYHPGTAKTYLEFDGTTTTINDSFNIASLTDVGVGLITENFSNPMSSVNGSRPAACINAGVSWTFSPHTEFLTTTTARFNTADSASASTDVNDASSSTYGDLA